MEIITVKATNGKCNLKDVINKLSEKGIQQILVEGGQTTITEFINQNLSDELVIYTSKGKLGKYGSVPSSQVMKRIYRHLKKHTSDKKLFGTDVRLRTLLNKP